MTYLQRLSTRGQMLALLLALTGVIAATPTSARASGVSRADTVRAKDLGRLQGWSDNALTGYGIVTGLAGTGDSPGNATTKQALSNVLSQFNLNVQAAQIQSRNVAVVLVSAALPPFARQGDALDVTVTSAGDARSLVGGSLLLAPLMGPNGRTYALAEGPLSVGGYRYDANGNVVQKNHPTVGSIPNGAKVEVAVHADVMSAQKTLTFVLTDPDYTTASRLASAVNAQLGASLARAKDAEGVEIQVPEERRDQLVAFISRIENVILEPDRKSRVVVNERTGTVVSGGEVRISPVAISQGDLKISITNINSASQPIAAWGNNSGVRTALITNTIVDVNEQSPSGYLPPDSTTVADLIQSLARLKTNTRDVISILRAIKTAGALHADLIIQ